MNCKVNDYIVRNYKELHMIANKITKGHELSEELLHECLLQLYEKDEIVLKKYCDSSIKYYITAVMRINYYSKTSPFYYKIRKEAQTYLELFDDFIYEPLYDFEYEEQQIALEKEKLICILENEYVELEWFEKSIFDLYIIMGSIKKVAKKTKIPVSNVARYIKEIRNKIKTNMINELGNE
jgi:DNA-directed RNA polymerase specialized sigma24 family protein